MNTPVFQPEHFPETLPNEQGYIADGVQRAENYANYSFVIPVTPDIAPSVPETQIDHKGPEGLAGHARVWAAHSLMQQLRMNHPAFPTPEVAQNDVVPRGAYGDRINPYHWN